MLYIERQPRCRSVVLLVTLSLLLYAGALLLTELRWDMEALQAAMSRDMLFGGDYVKTRLYGREIREFPLYSWLVCVCSGFQRCCAAWRGGGCSGALRGSSRRRWCC